jgi:hypothetical protein
LQSNIVFQFHNNILHTHDRLTQITTLSFIFCIIIIM